MRDPRRSAGRAVMSEAHIGRSLRRLEDQRFLTGQGRYVDDIDMPGQLHGIVLRSPHGHAAIDGIDTTAARAAAVSMPSIAACPCGERSTIPCSWPGMSMSST